MTRAGSVVVFCVVGFSMTVGGGGVSGFCFYFLVTAKGVE